MLSITKTKLELHAGLAAIAACAAALVLPAGAQQDGLTVEVGECVDLPTPERRLACFEAQVEAAQKEREADTARAARGASPSPAAGGAAPAPAARPAEPAPRVVEARVRPEPQRSPSAAQGASPEKELRSSRREEDDSDRLGPDIFARVAELRETVPNSYLITLDNGQIWRQTVPMAYALREGYEVRLYPSRWGDSYRLTNETLRGYIQVERVR